MDDGASDSSLSCVLTVPSGFDNCQRAAAVKCAEKAGFSVAQVISEEAAALLAHGVGQEVDVAEEEEEEAKIVVVYRAGGRSVTCSVVRVQGGFFSTLATKEVLGVGGEVLKNHMANFLANEFKRLAMENHTHLMTYVNINNLFYCL